MTQDSTLGERYNDSSGANQTYINDSDAQTNDKLTKCLMKNHPQYNTPEMKIRPEQLWSTHPHNNDNNGLWLGKKML